MRSNKIVSTFVCSNCLFIMPRTNDNIISGGPGPENFTFGSKSFGELCMRQLTENKDSVLLINSDTDQQWTGGDIKQSVILLANVLKYHVTENDVVAVCSENRIECITTYFSVFSVGATATVLNSEYSEGKKLSYSACIQ